MHSSKGTQVTKNVVPGKASLRECHVIKVSIYSRETEIIPYIGERSQRIKKI